MTARPVGPTAERARRAALDGEGGVERLESMRAGEHCHGVRYPLLVDRLRDKGLLAADLHDIALRARALYERSGERPSVAARYSERAARSKGDDGPDEAAEAFRQMDREVFRLARRRGWSAFRRIVL